MRRARAAVLVAVAVATILLVLPGSSPGLAGARAVPAVAPRAGATLAPATVSPMVSGGASTRILVTTGDALAVPNDGIATNLTAFPTATFPADSSFQTGAEEVIGTYEAVFGLFTNDKTPPTAFYSIFTNTTDQPIRNLYWTGLPIVSGVAYDFQLAASNGTMWTLSVNGVDFGNASAATFDFGARTSTWLGGVGFSEVAIYSATTTVPVSFVATTALAVRHPGGSWYLPVNGTANFTGPPSAAYGIEGRAQLSGLAPGEVVSGTSLAAVRSNELLWNSGPVPVDVAVSVAPATAAGLGFVNVMVTVTTPTGTPLGAVPVYVGDTLGGSAAPSTVNTEANGAANTILTLANESGTVGDSVRGVVTVLGYVGSASTGLTVGPSVQILVSASTSSLAIAPGATTRVTFVTRSAEGALFPGVALSFTPIAGTGSGSLSGVIAQPSSGTTDENGTITVQLLAPTVLGKYVLLAIVSDFGVWGRAVVSVDVRAPPPTLWERYGTTVILPALGAAVGVVVLVALVLLVRKRRGPRQGLPEMDLRRLRARGTESVTGPPAEPPPVSRTPPASGTP
ncbi:MAG TPA: hypothetical protein VN864_08900 [Thermoplasmata archaeon]|nr:hypothetical protein [Thermoplasmata archaeon]